MAVRTRRLLSHFVAEILAVRMVACSIGDPHLDGPAPLIVKEDVESDAAGSTTAATIVVESSSLSCPFFGISFVMSIAFDMEFVDEVRRIWALRSQLDNSPWAATLEWVQSPEDFCFSSGAGAS